MGFRPIGDSILIRFDPESDKVESGLLFKPTDATEHIFAKAEILSVGPGKWYPKGSTRAPMLMQPGDGVVVIRYLAKTKTGTFVQYVLGDDQLVIKPSDILFTYNRAEPLDINQ
jgi:co-chaperonin GroES (HSP10)